MILSKEFYDKCDPSYQKVIDELEQKLAEIYPNYENDIWELEDDQPIIQELLNIIMQFSANYLMPKEYWKYCIKIITDIEYEECYKINANAYYHLYFDRDMNMLRLPWNGEHAKLVLTDFQNKEYIDKYNYEADDEDLVYPHSHLKKCFRYFEEHSTHLPPKKIVQKYEEMKVLYLKIKSAEDDDIETWFKLLLEVNDDVFAKHNVEYRLGQNLLDFKLWKLYIRYLKQSGDYKMLLETYSKYCRFFLDDHEMLEEYKKASIEYGPVELQWDSLFDFEVKNKSQQVVGNVKGGDNVEDGIKSDRCVDEANEIKNAEDIGNTSENSDAETEKVVTLNKTLSAAFYDTYQIQDFALPGPLILYVLENASHQVLRKLFSTCKYFFKKKPTPICYRFKTSHKTSFTAESISLKPSENLNVFVKDFFITGSIDVRLAYIEHARNDYISSLIPRLYRCEAKYIHLVGQNLTFSELKFLIQHGGVIHLNLSEGIKGENNEFIALEKIMEYLPNIEKLHLREVKTTSNTAHALANQKFNAKIFDFSISPIFGDPFDSEEFLKYCIANRDEEFSLYFLFDNEFTDAAFVETFKEFMKNYEKFCEEYTSIEIDIL